MTLQDKCLATVAVFLILPREHAPEGEYAWLTPDGPKGIIRNVIPMPDGKFNIVAVFKSDEILVLTQ